MNFIIDDLEVISCFIYTIKDFHRIDFAFSSREIKPKESSQNPSQLTFTRKRKRCSMEKEEVYEMLDTEEENTEIVKSDSESSNSDNVRLIFGIPYLLYMINYEN